MMRIQQSGDIIHVYSTRATKYATRELEQAFGVDRGNSRRDPLGFPCRTVAQLKEVWTLFYPSGFELSSEVTGMC
jgi:hypothetical protein